MIVLATAVRGLRMPYASVDQLQKALAQDVFNYAQDPKKAAGRALGTLVEIITFYVLKTWGLEKSTGIERPLPEYANDSITHNVEYSLHPQIRSSRLSIDLHHLPFTAPKILHAIKDLAPPGILITPKSNVLLTRDHVLKHACTIWDSSNTFCNAYLDHISNNTATCDIVILHRKPFSVFECKRVGIEEGMKKGPQTIEKAKQGAYVARTVSSLQKIRFADGIMGGFIEMRNGLSA